MKKFIFLLLLPIWAIAQHKQLTLEDIYSNPSLYPERTQGFESMKDGRYYTESDAAGDILRKSFATGKTIDTLLKKGDVKDEAGETLSLDDIQWSNDEKKLLIFKGREHIYRYSTKAIVYVYDLATKTISKVADEKVLHATLSPKGNKIAFVKDNNLYIKDLLSSHTTQITTDGKQNNIINGNCDWVYEEEFSFTRAFEWSKEGNYLAYYHFNESAVPTYTIPIYDSLYPTLYTYKYPKAGEVNSVIDLYVYDLTNTKTKKMDIGTEPDIYIPHIQFTNNDHTLSITRLNRLQNKLELLAADVSTGNTSLIYNETNQYYIDVENMHLKYLEDGKSFVYTSEKSGFNHIYLQSIAGNKSIQLTKGNFDIDEILGIDEKNSIIYFTAAYRSPLYKDLCSVRLNGKDFKLLDQRAGQHSVNFSADYSYYIDDYSTLTTPPYVAIYNKQGKEIRMLTDNKKLKENIALYNWATPEFIKVPNSMGDSLNGMILKPRNFDSTKHYPVLFCNYGGPGSQTVFNGWNCSNLWQQMLAQKGYIIVSVDNTGTGFRGEAFKKKTYLQLGKYEIQDQIDAARYLGTLSYIDAKRIGHWGWSFGGFMSCLAISKGADVFKTAIAVAPVTNWQYYDNIYTERYMRTPKENPNGYNDNSPLNFVKNIKGKLLIIHGTADDNVHFQNSVMFIDAMIQNNVEFESGYYPNKNHSIKGGNTRYHLYNKMTKFILENL